MATAQSVCKRAIRALISNRSPSSDEKTDALEALNARVDTLKNEPLFAWSRQIETLTLVSSQYVYTIGPSGDLVTDRPVEIDDAWIEDSGATYGVRLITDEEYDAIPDKQATATWPRRANYKPTVPNGTLTLWRVPTQTSSLKLLTRIVPTAFELTTTLDDYPPGFEELFVSETAIVLAPEYGVPVPDSVIAMNKRARHGITLVNTQRIVAGTELSSLIGGRRMTNILTDE